MTTLLQRPPLAMFDPSLIHRNDEIFNPEPNGLGFFLRASFAVACFKALMPSESSGMSLTRDSERMVLAELIDGAAGQLGIDRGADRPGCPTSIFD